MASVITDPAQLALPLSAAPVSASGTRKLRDRVGLRIANLKQATEVIVRNHYLHRGRTMAQLPYWIRWTMSGRGAAVRLSADVGEVLWPWADEHAGAGADVA